MRIMKFNQLILESASEAMDIFTDFVDEFPAIYFDSNINDSDIYNTDQAVTMSRLELIKHIRSICDAPNENDFVIMWTKIKDNRNNIFISIAMVGKHAIHSTKYDFDRVLSYVHNMLPRFESVGVYPIMSCLTRSKEHMGNLMFGSYGIFDLCLLSSEEDYEAVNFLFKETKRSYKDYDTK